MILDGVNIAAAGGPAIKVDPGVKATVTLKSGSENTVTGAANYAGIEVGYEDGNLASLTLNGAGQLKATGGDKSAGIGGSYNSKTSQGRNTSSYCGNITIEGDPVINATGTNGGAGIGSANNNGVNSDGTTQSRSYKMQYSEIGAITIKGGDITAEGRAGAGIGGGNHCDSGVITIEGGTIHASSNDGAGIGCGRGSSNYGGDADKGHGYYFADVTVNGGTIYADGGWLSAGIGGGYECDAIVKINGGIIKRAVGGDGNPGSDYQGAPGIGAGYQGNVLFEMTGGIIEYAKGGTSAPGIGYGAAIQEYGSKRKADGENVSSADSIIKISGGTIELAEGGKYSAGIGSGNGCRVCNIEITGGDITAIGYSDSSNLSAGGAGIGSGVGSPSSLKYCADTDVKISITGGTVTAIGGWGASGIGSGADNITASEITIGKDASIEAYSDGTKFAIDTRGGENPDGTTSSITEGRNIDINLLQGTFVHDYKEEDGTAQATEGLSSIQVINDATGEKKILTGMPEGYRSFATDVAEPGAYSVFTNTEAISKEKDATSTNAWTRTGHLKRSQAEATSWKGTYSIQFRATGFQTTTTCSR